MIPRWLVVALAAWFALDVLIVGLLVLRARRRGPIFHPVESKEAPGGLQGPRPLP